MRPRDLILKWVDAFNSGDAVKLSSYYASDAINYQVAEEEVRGQAAIRQMFEDEFSNAEMHCIVENIFEDGEWGILEWKDPLGLMGLRVFPDIRWEDQLSARLLGQAVLSASAQSTYSA